MSLVYFVVAIKESISATDTHCSSRTYATNIRKNPWLTHYPSLFPRSLETMRLNLDVDKVLKRRVAESAEQYCGQRKNELETTEAAEKENKQFLNCFVAPAFVSSASSCLKTCPLLSVSISKNPWLISPSTTTRRLIAPLLHSGNPR